MRFEVRFELAIECPLSVAVVAWSQRYCLYLVSVMELLGIDVDHKIEVCLELHELCLLPPTQGDVNQCFIASCSGGSLIDFVQQPREPRPIKLNRQMLLESVSYLEV